jgi:hypothetical protein
MNELTPDQHRILVGAIHDSATVVHKGRMMNERIRELALQAGAQGIVNRDFIDVEKFAELIVQECEQVSLKNSHRDDDMGAIIARQIRQHFGVK